MRPRIIILALVVAGLIVGAAVYVKNHPVPAMDTQPVADNSAPVEAAQAPSDAPAHRIITGASAPSDTPPPVTTTPMEDSDPDAAPVSHEEMVIKREAQLTELGASGDPGALKIILPELNDADPGIRHAALAATLQMDNPDAIPALQNQMMYTDDLEEKLALQKAIEFLKIPAM